MNMRLYAFETGSLRAKKSIFAPGENADKLVEVPVQCFLIIHPRGIVLFDTGISQKVCENPSFYWGGAAKAFCPLSSPGKDLKKQLKMLGYALEDINYIIISHMHMDHIGNNNLFPAASFIVQDVEFKTALKPESEGNGYYRRDWDYPLCYNTIKGRKDLFGDGKIVLEPLPGHTAGLQVAIIDLPDNGKIVLASDGAAMLENLNGGSIPRNISSHEDYVNSIEYLQRLNNEGAMVICGHDPHQWSKIKKLPEYYS